MAVEVLGVCVLTSVLDLILCNLSVENINQRINRKKSEPQRGRVSVAASVRWWTDVFVTGSQKLCAHF